MQAFPPKVAQKKANVSLASSKSNGNDSGSDELSTDLQSSGTKGGTGTNVTAAFRLCVSLFYR